MILIADGGSTSVDWCLINKGIVIKEVITEGINPFFKPYNIIYKDINENLLPELKGYDITSVYFFGAGCISLEKNDIIRKAIYNNLKTEKINVESDLYGASIGLFGNNAGIVGILGTGSNSCFYDGRKIIENIPSLGYILGDEGSAAVLGRLFLSSCLKNQLSKGIKEKFLDEYKLTVPEILVKVYNQSSPNTFLGTLSYFISRNLNDESIYNLVFNALEDFFRKNIMQYDYKNYPVRLTGSISFVFAEMLKIIANNFDIRIENILESPMNGLINLDPIFLQDCLNYQYEK